jgi:hypothetical protein
MDVISRAGSSKTKSCQRSKRVGRGENFALTSNFRLAAMAPCSHWLLMVPVLVSPVSSFSAPGL